MLVLEELGLDVLEAGVDEALDDLEARDDVIEDHAEVLACFFIGDALLIVWPPLDGDEIGGVGFRIHG